MKRLLWKYSFIILQHRYHNKIISWSLNICNSTTSACLHLCVIYWWHLFNTIISYIRCIILHSNSNMALNIMSNYWTKPVWCYINIVKDWVCICKYFIWKVFSIYLNIDLHRFFNRFVGSLFAYNTLHFILQNWVLCSPLGRLSYRMTCRPLHCHTRTRIAAAIQKWMWIQ